MDIWGEWIKERGKYKISFESVDGFAEADGALFFLFVDETSVKFEKGMFFGVQKFSQAWSEKRVIVDILNSLYFKVLPFLFILHRHYLPISQLLF